MSSEARRWRRSAMGGAVAVVLAASLVRAAPVEGPLETVVFEAGDTIRGVAERYLKDADLWPQILELSGVGSPAELRPGTELMVPVQQVAAADEALAFSLVAIQKATAEGARIFAPVEIGSAIENRDTAVERRDVGRLGRGRRATPASPSTSRRPGAGDLARAARPGGGGGGLGRPGQRRGPGAGPAALVAAGRAGRAGRVRAGADAVGLDRAGDVPRPEPAAAQPELERDHPADAQRPADRRRGDQGQPGQRRLLRAPEPARRPHRLRGRGARASRPRRSRPTSGSSTRARSRASPTTTRRRSRSPAAPRRSASARTRARWSRESGDAGADRGAGPRRARRALRRGAALRRGGRPRPGSPRRAPRPTGSRWRRTPTSTSCRPRSGACARRAAAVEGLEPGDHFWRVSSLDRLGLPGVRSLSRRFTAASATTTPPFVTLRDARRGRDRDDGRGGAGRRERAGRAAVGRTAATCRSATDGASPPRSRRRPGANTVVVDAVDPAGNRTERRRSFVFRPGGAATIALDPALPRDAEGRLLTRAEEIDVAGTVDAEPVVAAPGARRRRRAGRCRRWWRRTERSTSPSRRRRPAPPTASRSSARTGRWRGRGRFAARQDAEPPEICSTCRRRPPPRTPGWSSPATRRTRSRSPSTARARRLADGRFDAVATLAPGANVIEIVARTRSATSRSSGSRPSTTSIRRRSSRRRRTAGGRGRADRDRGRGARRLGPAPGGAVHPDGRRGRAPRLPALRRRRRHLPRDAAAGAGRARARRGRGRGLCGQRGEAAGVIRVALGDGSMRGLVGVAAGRRRCWPGPWPWRSRRR